MSLVENLGGRYTHSGTYLAGADGEQTWGFAEFTKTVQDNHSRLAALWPQVRAMASSMSGPSKTAWNATVYRQQGMELQLAAALRQRAGSEGVTLEQTAPLGVFAGLPGGGVAFDPLDVRFQVPRLTVTGSRAAVGFPPIIAAVLLTPTAIKIGAWVVGGIIALGALLMVLRVTGVTGMIQEHVAATAYWDRYVASGGVLDKPKPPKPPGGMGIGMGIALGIGAVGVAYVATR